MKIKNKILQLLLFLGLISYGQSNLIHNALLEQPINNATPFYKGLVDNYTPKGYYYSGGWHTVDYGEQEGLSVWESRINPKTTILTEPGESPEKVQLLLHSPDWFMVNKFGGVDKIRETESGADVMPFSGMGYVGMGPGELMQQKFFVSNKFEESESYTLNFYIRTIDNPARDWSTGLDLKVYFRKSKMKYSIGANQLNNRCDPTKYYNKQSLSNTISIIDKPIDLANYPTGQWYQVTVEFIAPADSYDWIVIETESSNLCDGPYLLLDDFSLKKTCEVSSCSRTSGEVFPHHNGFVSSTIPLSIDNLDNASNVTLEIKTISGAAIWNYSVMCTNGIQDTIFWDGRNMSGSSVANASYLLKTTYTNDCGTESKTSIIIKTGNHPSITNNIICNSSGVETPISCCVYEPDLIIDNITLPGIGLLNYEVINSIKVAPAYNVIVTSNATVEMRAGTEILLNPGFSTLMGAKYFAEIVPCPKSNKSVIIKGRNLVQETNIDENLDEKAVSTISPNPTTDISTLLINNFKNGNTYEINIYNIQGQLVKSLKSKNKKLQLNLSGFNNGLYFIKVFDGVKTETIKLIKR